jgi:thiol-disulfide isomerase/thioredoxin
MAAIALGACGAGDGAGNPDSRLSLEEATRPLQNAPAPLVEVREQANELLAGGTEAFEARLRALRGTPVVVNKWASWCGPCRLEFPFFQDQAIERGDRIAFLGVDSDDSEGAARTFLDQLPLPYPSYSDPESRIAELIEAELGFPSTVIYDSSGEIAYKRPGGYADESELAADIDRYAR